MFRVFLLVFIFMSGCLRTHKEVLDEGGDLIYKEKPVQSQSVIDRNYTLMNERLDSLERNTVNKQDVDTDIDSLRNVINQLQTRVAYLEKQIKQNSKDQNSINKKESAKKDSYNQAESYFRDKKWKQAIFAYEKFRKAQPQSLRFSKATLKIGMSFVELGLNKEAQVFFKEVVERFPKSEEAKEAKKLLEKKDLIL